jgi:ParB family transcriptional regulator, chromosome partitioning protein
MDQDNSRLGRGLESLIPKNNNAGSAPQQPSHQFQQQQQRPAPQQEPFRQPPADHILPAEPALPELPAEPELPELPAAQPITPPIEPAAYSGPVSRPVQAPIIEEAAKTDDEYYPTPYDAIFHIEVDKIKPNPDQPRKFFDEQGLRDLAASIREFGILQPLVVTKTEKEVPTGTQVEYYLISGERRLRASQLLGLERVPAIVRNVAFNQERLELAIIENIQRENLNAIETARAMARLQDEFRLTQREIAARLGKSRETIANTVRLLDLPPKIQEAIEQNRISESHGRLLLSIQEPALQEKLFRDLLERGMTTRELRTRVEAAKPKRQSLLPPQDLSPELKMFQERLSSELGAPVKIQQDGESGKITISFYSPEELQQILSRLSSRHSDGY